MQTKVIYQNSLNTVVDTYCKRKMIVNFRPSKDLLKLWGNGGEGNSMTYKRWAQLLRNEKNIYLYEAILMADYFEVELSDIIDIQNLPINQPVLQTA